MRHVVRLSEEVINDFNNPFEKSFFCAVCLQRFGRKSNLHQHMKYRHSGLNPDTNVQNKNTHPRKSEENPHICQLCHKELPSLRKLRQHKIIHHPEITPFKCTFCDKSFKMNDYLKYHLNSEHGVLMRDKSFIRCETCLAIFSSLQLKTDHVKQYHPELRPQCRICKVCFSNKKQMIRHELNVHNINIDHPDQLFRCDVCNKAYSSHIYLTKHMISKHRSSLNTN